MRGNNQEVTSAFFAGKEEGSSHTGNLHFNDGVLYSYRMPIARRLWAPNLWLVRDSAESPSVTTSQHISRARRSSYRKADRAHAVHFDLLEHAGVDYEDIQSVREFSHAPAGYVVQVSQGYLTYYCQYNDACAPLRAGGGDVPVLLYTKDRPQTAAHLMWSMLPSEWWPAAFQGRVHRVGDVFFVLDPDASPAARDESIVRVARTGRARHAVKVLRRSKEDDMLCTGQVRISGASFTPDKSYGDWYRVVPSRLRSYTHNKTKNLAQKAPEQELIEWPIPPSQLRSA